MKTHKNNNREQSAATGLIEQMEKEAGCRWDDNNGENNAMAGIVGALARAMGKSQHKERDDIAAGILLKHRMSSWYREEQTRLRMVADMLREGVSSEAILSLIGNKK